MNSNNLSTNDVDYAFNFGNYDPDNLEVSETINAVFVIDTSGSVGRYVNELNSAYNEFLARMQKSHAADQLLVSLIEFNDTVHTVNGFMPIKNMQPVDFASKIDGSTALYDACKVGLKNAIDYRTSLENSGVNCKTLLFVITDGEDNSSNCQPSEVKDMIKDLLQEERNIFSFESILFGVGRDSEFEKAQKAMGIKHLAKVGTTADEIRKMIAFISASITNVSTGQGVSTPNF
jgi:uncharacterized protein YegL